MSFRKRGLTGQLDHRRFKQADIEFAIYIRPVGTHGQHKVRPVGGGPEFQVWTPPGFTYSPGTQVPLGSNAGMLDRFIINPGGGGGGPPDIQEEIVTAPAVRVGRWTSEGIPDMTGDGTGDQVRDGQNGEYWPDVSGHSREAFCNSWMERLEAFTPSGHDVLQPHGNPEVFLGPPDWTGSYVRTPLGFACLFVIRDDTPGEDSILLGGASMDITGVYRNDQRISGASIFGSGRFHLVEIHRSNQLEMSVFIDSVDVTTASFLDSPGGLIPETGVLVDAEYIAEVSYWSGGMTAGQMTAERAALLDKFEP